MEKTLVISIETRYFRVHKTQHVITINYTIYRNKRLYWKNCNAQHTIYNVYYYSSWASFLFPVEIRHLPRTAKYAQSAVESKFRFVFVFRESRFRESALVNEPSLLPGYTVPENLSDTYLFIDEYR